MFEAASSVVNRLPDIVPEEAEPPDAVTVYVDPDLLQVPEKVDGALDWNVPVPV